MGSLRKFAVAGVLSVLLAAGAQAADAPKFPSLPLPLSDKTPPLIEEFSSGWYLRGDLGYRSNTIDSATNLVAPNPAESHIDKSVTVGGGFGYKAKWFRADVTGDYIAPTKYSGGAAGVTTRSTRIDGFNLLVNGYLDLGTWYGITPYIGGGAGGAYLSGSDYASVPAQAVTPPIRSNWNFAWAYMAGVSFVVHPNFLIDVGYRHIKLGDAESGPDSNRLTLKDISADEFRIGLRYLLD